jgi:hypothetical protein
MSQVIRIGAFREVNSHYRFRFQPNTAFHFFGGQSLAPAVRFLLRQIGNGAFGDLEALEMFVDFTPCRGNEAASDAGGEEQVTAV